ncbi:MAG: hypothetical protein ACK4E2_09655 [Pseudothermotoga sp.]
MNADADSFASAYWGYRTIGGGIYVDNPDLTVLNLMKRLNVRNLFPEQIHCFYVYDTCEPQKVPFSIYNYRIFDHHNNCCLEFLSEADFVYVRRRTANVMNLYDLSEETQLDEKVLFAFAVALVTDTAFLKTAKAEEAQYLAKFLNDHTLEEVFDVILFGRVKNSERLVDVVSKMQVIDGKLKIGLVECENDDEFLCVVDLLMFPLGFSIIIGRLPWGIWIYCKKNLVQKVYQHILKNFPNREAGKLFGFYNFDLLIDLLEKL